MLKPSLNDIVEKIDNRYYLIATVSKRAREIVNGEEALVEAKETDKPVVVASEEIIHGKVGYRLLTDEEIKVKELAHKLEQERKLMEQD
ncbi:DNA-directed RNA polymerase subunit omega [Peptostreptococcus canis]|uniref:DNA-directed RNA polymerase subunit omega n=1 Tax=Peptostreptococcus canis TaxID=1159213 RepID=A0ABR6TJP9_9FIRM|nr:DNA-directed RNA polymerase subunit omega [Peptostreptococcus canis]MBC2575638.1 DNA-directed RNA polymerase subunit omega [Peptostreptococcus canis]MBP1997157.1 DNA-directed RNA polymerase subunit omega [Peptostreptococcus canis]